MAKKADIKSLVENLEKEELIEVILELSKISKQNEQFLRIFLQGSEKENVESAIADAKKKIESVFYRNSYPQTNISIKTARTILSDYSKLLKDFPISIIDLKIFYVETGVSIISGFGYEGESIFNSMATVFRDVCNSIFQYPSCYSMFSDRLNEIVEISKNIGYGFHDYIVEFLLELEGRIDIKN